MINLIVARSRNNVIGNAAGIPWHIKGEQKQFKELTTNNVVIMGRKTYEDMGRPLPNRLNIVVSNTKSFDYADGNTVLKTAHSLKEAIETIPFDYTEDMEIYIAGGQRMYEEAIASGIVDRMYITEVDTDVAVDHTTVFFPEFDENMFEKLVGKTAGEPISYTRTVYVRKGLDFSQYDL